MERLFVYYLANKNKEILPNSIKNTPKHVPYGAKYKMNSYKIAKDLLNFAKSGGNSPGLVTLYTTSRL